MGGGGEGEGGGVRMWNGKAENFTNMTKIDISQASIIEPNN